MNNYIDKFNNSIQNTFFSKLPHAEQEFIKERSMALRFSHQEIKQIVDIARDLGMWDEKSIVDIFPEHEQKKVVFARLKKAYEELRSTPNSYENFELKNIPTEQKYTFKTEEKNGFGLGLCPVASEKTRCCNLLTLDAVESCGFDCSYCSIQSFYKQNTITFAKEVGTHLNKKLQEDAYWKLVIIAEPRFLGVLRGNLSKPVAEVVSLEIDKNLTNLPVDDIHKHLLKYL